MKERKEVKTPDEAKSIGDQVTFFGVTKAIWANFSQAHNEWKRRKNTGSEYPGYHCPERKELDTKLKELDDSAHHVSVSAVNDGHDAAKVPLHPKAKKALLMQAIENDTNYLPPNRPHALSYQQEMRNAKAFYKAYLDPEYKQYRNENLAGFFIHYAKGIAESTMNQCLPSEEYVPKFGARCSDRG
ncbi:hypothetical protein [Legionella micdadei]|uniref:Uncharacterized protein n=1 Tax=Legionella micdadei TaxID=451 RepID=A0A098GFT8_LEGMI|nr:hypothetical protein [Legionella micdadei]ARG98021.1 hypothetical protein B6N58_10310 [Legionella micdadei]ARH00817.1 hypothetical protein B6V88_10530 [Legionella micdadei]KTD30156.1 hypothetical protein Lmic_0337 [Legionella micdadei]NSL18469.1 hypothetical protein [Legionella micdadei]CEG60351.1 protein of unknown function [Legionella micdadei]